ncbi:unnamed protein product [Prunus armeniaca]
MDSTDQTVSSTPLALANAVEQEAATDNAVLIRGMDLDVFNAAKEGKTDVLSRHYLDQILTPTKNTVLHIYIAFASSPNYIEPEKETLRPPSVVNEILQMCPALLSQKNESGETALHIVARHGRADIVERLIETAKAGRDLENGPSSSVEAWQMLIRETNKERDTALHFAVRFNHFRVVEILTREDPDFSYSANDAGETPLYLAAERKYGVLVSQILSTCTDPNYQGPNGRTALHAAVIYGDKTDGEPTTVSKTYGRVTPKRRLTNDAEMTKEILEKKKDLAIAADEKGWTPLHYAAFYDRASIVIKLLETDKRSAYMGDKADKKTALHISASRGHVKVMEQIISQCPDCCEVVDQRGRNAFHYALEMHRSLIKDFVLKDPWLCNVLLNSKDVDGNTPLHLLDGHLFGGRVPFIRDARVDKMAFNKENMNALDVIIAKDSKYKTYLKNNLKRNGAASGHRILSESSRGSQKFKENKGGEDTDVNESHLIVATLVATVTFAAGFTMPGGYYQIDASKRNVTAPALSKGSTPGYAVLTKDAAFIIFVISDSLALCLSSFSVLMHLYISTHTKRKGISEWFGVALYITMLALVAMVVAFTSGTYAVLGDSPLLAISALMVDACVFFIFIYFAIFEIKWRFVSDWLDQLKALLPVIATTDE